MHVYTNNVSKKLNYLDNCNIKQVKELKRLGLILKIFNIFRKMNR